MKPLSIGGDRNARVLREHHHKQFVERVRSGLATPLDRFGKPLTVGDLVLWHPTMDPCCQIVGIEALPLDKQPPGHTGVTLILQTVVKEAVNIEHPAIFFAQVGHVEQPATDTPAAADGAPAAEPPAPAAPLEAAPRPSPTVPPTEPADDSID